jgi:short-subunit dehydrogenase
MNNGQKGYALVTGGTSGIGYELARKLAADSYDLIIVARTEARLMEVTEYFSREYGVNCVPIIKDLFNPESAFELYEEIRAKDLTVDILVNDAGQGYYGQFAETDIRRELAIISLNVSSLVVLTKLFLKDMVGRGYGKILNVSSIASKTPGPWHSVYHATKAFVQSFTEAVRSELKDTGITVTALLPGATATDFFNKADMNDSKIVVEGKLASAEEVAADGYEALMDGDDMVISGLKNKVQVAQSTIVSDSMAADMMKKQQEPAETPRN